MGCHALIPVYTRIAEKDASQSGLSISPDVSLVASRAT